MPILSLSVGGEGPAANGDLVQLEPREALRRRGPVIGVTVNIARNIAEQLAARGGEVPVPISGAALIDTGASRTCVDDNATRLLGIPPTDVVRMRTAALDTTFQNVYPIQVEVIGTPMRLGVPRAVGASLSQQGLILLLGRDALQHLLLVYDGTTGRLTLAL